MQITKIKGDQTMEGIHIILSNYRYPTIHQPTGKGFIYFRTLRLISQGERT